MNDDVVIRATGKNREYWFDLLNAEKMDREAHPTIAARLAEESGISEWWSQQLTVLYEQHIGRRIPGQTADGRFQIGVNKTLPVSAEVLWRFLESPAGIAMVCSDGRGPEAADLPPLPELKLSAPDSIQVEVTTYKALSHFRMRWKAPDWTEHSILQVRLTPKDSNRCQMTFHQERLPDLESRDRLKERWKDAAARIEKMFAAE